MPATLAELGRKHATYGVRPEQYEILTAASLWTLNQALGADFDARTSEAWKIALAAVSETMRLALTSHRPESGAGQEIRFGGVVGS